MSAIEKKKYDFEGIDCANCANKIEGKLNDLSFIIDAKVNIVNKKISLEYDESYEDIVFDEINKALKKEEPEAFIIDKGNHIHKNINKIKVIKLLISSVLFFSVLFLSIDKNIKDIVFLIAYLISGLDILKKTVINIAKGEIFDENLLMGIATIGAISIGKFPEAIVVILLYKLGEIFEDLAVNKSRNSISSLMNIKAEFANRINGNEIEKIEPEKLKIEDILLIKPGEKVAVDGEIIEGSSTFDTSSITGESIPKNIDENGELFSGFINKTHVIKMRVKKEYKDSTVYKILEMIENATEKKSKTEKFITKFSKIYTPIVVSLAVLVALVPPFLLGMGDFNIWLYRALIFLVISCPCAMIISIPLSYFASIGVAAKNGILVKGSNFIEALRKIETVAFDKTGTITESKFAIKEVETTQGITREEVINYAYIAENNSNHPIAEAINKEGNIQIARDKYEGIEELSGHGLVAKYNGDNIYVGNEKLMHKFKISFEKNNNSGTVVYVALNKKFLGSLVLEDKIKNSSKMTIIKLKKMGIKTIMLTGDNKLVADKVGKEVGVDEIYSELLPQNKVEIIEKLEKERKGKIIFIGDGINDAPVLARSHVGISMGGVGQDAAIEASDIVFMNDNLSKLIEIMDLSKFTKKIVTQNMYFIFIFKIVILLLGTIGLSTLWAALIADVGVALLAIANSMRILRR